MAQNSQRIQWSAAEVDAKLNDIMTNCYNLCLEAGAKWSNDAQGAKGEGKGKGVMPSLLAGANVAGFVKVADAMKVHGDWW